MKKTLLAAGVAGCLAVPAQADIFISEIVEGSSYNKAIEIGNNGDSAVTLTGYSVAAYYGSGGYWNTGIDLNEYTIAAGDVLVLAHTSANDEILAEADIITSSGYTLSFNGNDAIGLFIDDELQDVVGYLSDTDYNKDVTLLRSYDQTPSTSYDEDSWEEADKDDWSDLGTIAALTEATEATAPDEYTETTIMAMQGSGDSSPLIEDDAYESDATYKVTGIVTGVQATSGDAVLNVGFFIQDASGDGDSDTSDGIYVYYSDVSNLGLSVGDEVDVYGTVKEYYELTELAAEYVEKTGDTGTIAATALRTSDSDENFDDTLERYEGMYVELDETAAMHITRTFGYDYDSYRNNMVVSYGDVNVHPNQNNGPTSTAATTQSTNNAYNRLFIESMVEAGDGIVPWYSTFGDDNGTGATDQYLRVGAVVSGMTGFIGYDYDEYRFYVEDDLDLDASNFVYADGDDRTDAPDLVEGDLKIATFNVLNYFNSEVDGAENPWGSNRGADNADDLAVQTAKIVSALVAIDADIVGLMELENNGFTEDSAIVALVTALNDELDEDEQYSFVQPDGYSYIGSDAITNAVIYRASTVSLDSSTVIEMPQQDAPSTSYTSLDGDDSTESGSNYQRDALVPTFTHILSGETFTIAVNHLKSKGSTCYDDVSTGSEVDDDQQGSCEALRVSGAYYLAEQLKDMDGYTLIVGDLNSYGNEDAIMLLTNQDNAATDYEINAAAYTYVGGDEDSGTALHGEDGAVLTDSYGYINLVDEHEEEGMSYSYNDEIGTLDYILGSAGLEDLVIDAAHWNINASESDLFQYDYDYGDVSIYNDAYRSSDHDPAIIVLELGDFDDATTDADDEETEEEDDSENIFETLAGSFDPLSLLSLSALFGLSLRRRKR
jgi:predicted extracellular nuclease